jgi:two-component system NtrC family sensor kinase
MSSLGRFTASIIHEINNPLGNILNYTQLLIEKIHKGGLEKDDELKMLDTVLSQGKKVSDFVKELLSFSRKESEKLEPSSLNRIVDRVMQFVRKDVKYPNIALELDIQPDLHDVLCSESRIEQVLVNLVNNARYALWKKFGEASSDDKKIVIRTRDVEKNGKKWSTLSVKDFGTGIPRDHLNQIFEPFFTTKPKKEGTGLGLSIVYQIIEAHGGFIEVFSEEGTFTEFVISIPWS